ncbi:hypothetical protein AAG906_029788 [Vitis piasezkii]
MGGLGLDGWLWIRKKKIITLIGLATGYIDAREHSGGERHFDVDWSSIIEDLYSPELGNPLGCRGSACVEVMTTLHGSTPSLFEACRGLRTAGGTPSLHVGASEGLRRSDFVHSLDTPSWVRVEGRLVRYSERQSMDQQVVTVDQFTAAMASIQEALASLRQEISGQQGRPPVARDDAQYDPTVPPPPPPSQSAPQAMPFTLHSQTGLRTSDRATTWEGFDGVPVASLPAKFRMPDIERRGVCSSFISGGKIAEIIDRPLERDQIQMVLRSLHPVFARHVVGVPFADFGSLVMALYDVEDSISRGLWTDSSPSDIKGKKPFVGPRPADVSAIGSSSQRPLRRHQPIPQFLEPHSSYASHQYRPQTPRPAYDQTYTPQTLALPYYASQGIERPPVSYGHMIAMLSFDSLRDQRLIPTRARQTFAPFALRTQSSFHR